MMFETVVSENLSNPRVGLCLGPYGGPMGGGLFLMSEVPLHTHPQRLFYRVTSLIRAPPTPGTYSRPMHKALWESWGGGFL